MSDTIPNKNARKKLLHFEAAGFVFNVLAAAALHFIYELSGNALYAAIFCSVNESVWEHMKIFSIPYVVWGFVEVFCSGVSFKRLAVAKVCGLCVITALIPVLFYTYTGILGRNIAVLDIICGVAAAALAYFASFRTAASAPCPGRWFAAASLVFALYCAATVFFTFAPPQIGIFRDPVSGGYGLPSSFTGFQRPLT